MPEPEDEDVVAKRVVYETRTASSNRGTGVTLTIIAVIAIALIVWLVMQVT
ncbi:MAG TPA: hypothetical protein VE010_06440 [Thermoanaerobaculia bacterium]|nr:hypothetical protein [Thermoanaerobaculia bacterium]